MLKIILIIVGVYFLILGAYWLYSMAFIKGAVYSIYCMLDIDDSREIEQIQESRKYRQNENENITESDEI